MDITTIVIAGSSISTIAVVQGLVRAAREAGLPSKYAALLATLIGAIIGVAIASYSSTPVFWGLMGGVVVGLMASGLYDVSKFAPPKQ